MREVLLTKGFKMNALEVTNPVLITQVLHAEFCEMDEAKFRKTLRTTLERAEAFAKSDDSQFSSSLTVEDAIMYACHVRSFVEAVEELKIAATLYQRLASLHLAKCVAFWQVVSTFRTLHGRTDPIQSEQPA